MLKIALQRGRKAAGWLMLLLTTLLSGCGFHLQNSGDLAPSLHSLYLNTPNPYSPFSIHLANQLEALGIVLVDSPKEAEISLVVTKADFTETYPTITTANQPTSITSNLNISYSLNDASGLIVYGPRTFITTAIQTINANQVFNTSITQLVKPQLIQDAVSLIYTQLTTIPESTFEAHEKMATAATKKLPTPDFQNAPAVHNKASVYRTHRA